MCEVDAIFRSLPADARIALERFEKRFDELQQHPFGFGPSVPPHRLKQVDAVIRNRAFLQKLMLAYYVDKVAGFGGEIFSEGSHVVPLLTRDGWVFGKPLYPDEIAYNWDANPPGIRNPRAGLADQVRQNCEKTIKDLPTYRLLAMEGQESQVTLKFGPGGYKDYYETCEGLTWELGEAVLDLFKTVPEQIRREDIGAREIVERVSDLLKFRNEVNPFDFSPRSMTPGVNTLTVMPVRGGHRTLFFMHDRSKSGKGAAESQGKPLSREDLITELLLRLGAPDLGREGEETPKGLAEAIDTWHVVPAGTFQPLAEGDPYRDVELRIERNVMREFGEELLSKEELIGDLSREDPQRPFEEDAELRHLYGVFQSRAVEIRLFGCALDCVTLKPEILTLLVINGDELLRGLDCRRLRNNWEGRHLRVEFTEQQIGMWLQEPTLLPAAGGCLALCLRQYEAILNMIGAVATAVGGG